MKRVLLVCLLTANVRAEPVRMVIECEDMQGVAQDKFGPGPGWQVGRWGYDLYQNMIFGGVWSSRLRNAMTDAGDGPAQATSDIEVPRAGTYKVWVKYECPPYFNYAFGIKIQSIPAQGPPALDQTYGLRQSARHFSFNDKLITGDLYRSWGLDHDAAEGYEVQLSKGRYRVTLSKAKNPSPAGARSIDAILITSDLSPLSSPNFPRYPLLDELRRANHLYFRFRNQHTAPIRVSWNHWGHRYQDFYTATYRELVKHYDAQGKPVENGDRPIGPGEASSWYDLGPTLNTESASPFDIRDHVPADQAGDPSRPVGVDIALEPDDKKIVKSFELAPGEASLAILVQPDLQRPEGVEHTQKLGDIYRGVTGALNQQPRLGPIPKRMRMFAGTGALSWPPATSDLPVLMEFRQALGLNTLQANTDPKQVPAILEWAREHGGMVERSLSYHHTTDPQTIIRWVKEGGMEENFYSVSFGDEIGLPALDGKDPKQLAAFREFLEEQGETPQSLGLAGWDELAPQGVLPKDRKRVYWYSLKFAAAQAIESMAGKTRAIQAALGNQVHTTANLGGMHPFYWMQQRSFIDAFKGQAMSLAWSEDYAYCQPEASRLVVDFQTAYLRKGASYHDTPMQFYCMPHWPGNTPEELIQNAVLEWGQNVKDLDFFWLSPDAWATENYVTYRGGLPTWKAARSITGMAGLIEDHLLPAHPEPTRIALVLSESSDVWELEGKGQWEVQPGKAPSNISQEERKAIWYALRLAGYRVDLVSEEDCAQGLLDNYSVLYLCGHNLDRKAARAIKDWTRAGGSLLATAGAARQDEFDASLTELDEVLGRGPATVSQLYGGPLRARLELPLQKPLEQITLGTGKSIPVLCSREEFALGPSVQVLGRYRSGQPAWVANAYGQGHGYYIGALPGQTYLQAGLPLTPCGKGVAQTSPWMMEPMSFDAVAASLILYPVETAGILPDVRPNHRGVVTNRLKSQKSTLITVVNLAQQIDGDLPNVEFEISGLHQVTRAWSCFHSQGSLPIRASAKGIIVTLPSLRAADVIVLE